VRFAWDCVKALSSIQTLRSREKQPQMNADGHETSKAEPLRTRQISLNQCVFSPDRAYRYVLRHRCADMTGKTPRRIAWIGLNPSTADEANLDQTLATVCRYSRNWGFSDLVMLNLFAFRATDPRDLKRATDPIGPDNNEHLLAEVGDVDRVIACWGDHGRFLGRDRQVLDLLKVSFECLLRNRTGAPHHPLYLKSRIRPKPFRLDQIRN
jgi:hypothetical protein